MGPESRWRGDYYRGNEIFTQALITSQFNSQYSLRHCSIKDFMPCYYFSASEVASSRGQSVLGLSREATYHASRVTASPGCIRATIVTMRNS